MSSSVLSPEQPSIADIATKLLSRMIFPSPSDFESVKIYENRPWRQCWLPIKLNWGDRYPQDERRETEETILLLRALSQMSRRFRAVAIPLLWAVVHVSSIGELGRLTQTLRVSPGIASHIKSFCFFWEAPRDAWFMFKEEVMRERKETLLEVAFQDRFPIWLEIAERKDSRAGEPAAKFVGPDGRGFDELIKSPQELNTCLVEILTQLKSLRTLG